MDNIFGNKQIKVVRHHGDLNTVLLEEDGTRVNRSKNIFVNMEIGLVNCAPYDNHFMFKHVFNSRGWTLWCTCGSPAGVVNYDAYAKDSSANMGALLVCLHHAGYNQHLDGSS